MRVFIFILLLSIYCACLAQPFPEVLFDRSGESSGSHYGRNVFSLGDQNDDGFMDWGVTACCGFAGQEGESITEFFHGGNPPSGEPYMVFRADPTPMIDMVGAEAIGDVNGDGYIDWMTDIRYRPDYDTKWYEVYWGGPEPSEAPEATFLFPVGDQSFEGMGGDFNGDGYDDLISHYFDDYYSYSEIFFGGSVLDTLVDLRLDQRPHGGGGVSGFGDVNGDNLIDILTDTGENHPLRLHLYAFFGSTEPDTIPDIIWEDFATGNSRIIVNDVNGDGRDDIIIGFPETINVHFGGETMSREPDVILDFTGCENDGIDRMNSIGDFNDDGYGDFTVFSYGCSNGHGKMAMYLGHRWMPTDPALEILGRFGTLGLIGPHVGAGLGDVNGDHIDDFAIGATNGSNDGARGRCVVLAGNREYVVPVTDLPPTTPESFALKAYPNPFNAETTIEMELPASSGMIELTIYNTMGQIVHSRRLPAWNKIKYRWDAAELCSGIYVVQVEAGNLQAREKVVMVK